MALELTYQEKAPLAIRLHYSDGSTADPGDQFHFVFGTGGVAELTGGPGAYFVSGVSAGTTTLTVADMGGSFSTALDIVVTGSPPPPPPVVVLDGIEAVPGAPEPK